MLCFCATINADKRFAEDILDLVELFDDAVPNIKSSESSN